MKRTTQVLAALTTVALGAGVVIGIRNKPNGSQYLVQNSNSAQSQTGTKQSTNSFDKKQYSIDDPTSIWIVVNKRRPLSPKTYVPSDLTSVGSGQSMRTVAAAAYQQLVAAASKAGYTLVPESGYRSYATQTSVYGNEVSKYGQSKADSESARPGYSEHQTGWAIDIASPGCLEDCFGTTEAAKWVLAHASTYGFIRRYAPDKSAITGYRNEPWHFRYVGPELATELGKTGQTLEEFFGLPAAPSY